MRDGDDRRAREEELAPRGRARDARRGAVVLGGELRGGGIESGANRPRRRRDRPVRRLEPTSRRSRAERATRATHQESADPRGLARRDLAHVEERERALDAGHDAQVTVPLAAVLEDEVVDGEQVGGRVHLGEDEAVERRSRELRRERASGGNAGWRRGSRERGTHDGFKVVEACLTRVDADELARPERR